MTRGSRPALRLVSLLAAFSLLFVAVAVRLVQLQVVRAQPLGNLGAKQRVRAVELPARRGPILDRDLAPLAVSGEARAIYANPRLLPDPAEAADALAPVLGVPRKDLLLGLERDAGFVYLARQVPPEVADRVQALGIPTVGALVESRRVYPSGTLCGQVLGFVGTDGQGLAGIESRYDDILRGIPGEVVFERDPGGRPIPQGRRERIEAVPGRGIVLTLDQDVQFYVERALARGARATRARYGSAVVLDPKTGDILAMANWPSLDPARFGDAPPDVRRNRAVTDAYEPGSVNKVITAAAAIESGIAWPGMRMKVPDSLRVADKTFHDFAPHPTLDITYAQALAQSSNIGTIQVALRLGKKRLARALERFGFGRPTGIGFPGESSGIVLDPRDWYPTSIGTIPIGQGVAVTPLQIAAVYATIANDGVWMRPRLIRGVVQRDGRFTERAPSRGRRVVGAYTAARVRSMLIGVVERGTGARAQIPGYVVAGKTGTARVPYVDRRGYSSDIITTFAGMAPADDPRLVVLVSLYNPTPRYAALTAAPIVREILVHTLAALRVPPSPGYPRPTALDPAP